MVYLSDIYNARILIVDDQQSNAILLGEMLRDAGYVNVASTTDPYAACELHRTNHYDLILLDLLMPGMDGFQVMEGLKEIETDGYLPVLVITAQPDYKLRALAIGAKDFVAKPFDLGEVQTRIQNMLEVRMLYRKLDDYNKALERTVQERTDELRASETRFRRLNELPSDWYWEQDENGHFTKISGPVQEMPGFRVNAAPDNLMVGQWARGNDTDRKILEANIAARRPFLNLVHTRTHPDGSRQYLMVRGEPMFDLSGRFIGYHGIGKDMTEKMLPNYVSPQNHQTSLSQS